jgi:hypothetical protein
MHTTSRILIDLSSSNLKGIAFALLNNIKMKYQKILKKFLQNVSKKVTFKKMFFEFHFLILFCYYLSKQLLFLVATNNCYLS